jgi:hypothetical protein
MRREKRRKGIEKAAGREGAEGTYDEPARNRRIADLEEKAVWKTKVIRRKYK